MDEARIRALIEQKTEEETYKDCYLVDLKYNPTQNHLTVYLGSDSGMTLEKCQVFSRHLEGYLDESGELGEKYKLDVSSPGIGSPLKLVRQYRSNIGRDLKVWLQEGKQISGELIGVEDDKIVLRIIRGKKKEEEIKEILFENINKAIVQIKF